MSLDIMELIIRAMVAGSSQEKFSIGHDTDTRVKVKDSLKYLHIS